MQSGYLNDEMNQNSNMPRPRERGGLIPITAHILSQATVNPDEAIEYNGNLLSDICLVGYITNYKEFEARVKVQIWDQTGTIEVIFYSKNESESNSGLSNFHYDGTRRPVKIFGTAKVYKREKNLQGAKIMYVTDNDLFYHYLEVVNDWLYLTGKLPQLKQESMNAINDSARNIARGNYNNPYGGQQNQVRTDAYNPFEIAQTILSEYTRKGANKIAKNEFNIQLQKKIRSDQVNSVINNLLNEGIIMEEDETYYEIVMH